MDDSKIVVKSEFKDKYFDYIESRRLFLLKVLLSISILVAAIFIPVNISLGIWPLVYIEIGIIVFLVCMFICLSNTENTGKCSTIFITVAAAWSVAAAASSYTDYSTFVWNAYVPAATFFLLGKRKGLIFCSIYIPAIVAVFIYRDFYSSIEQPTVQHNVMALNLITYTVLISVLYLYYESTRAHTESLLIDDIKHRKKTEAEKVVLIEDLKKALAEVKILRGLLPVCSCCKKIRDDNGYWNKLEVFIEEHSEAQFSHGMCPDCASQLYPDMDIDFASEHKKEFPSWSGEDQEKVDSTQEK